MTRLHRSSAGFTLIEMIMVIVITGIIAGVVAVFITKPVQGYVDSVRRAELTDAADVALRRITRDVRLALPNSLRLKNSSNVTVPSCVGGTECYIEFIMTKSGGRYRDPADGSTDGNFLDFTSATNVSFDVLGSLPMMAASDFIVVYNLGPDYEPGNAYNYDGTNCLAGGCNIAKVSAIASNVITLDANPFAAQSPPLPSPNSRFQVVDKNDMVVRYGCSSAGVVTRYRGCQFNSTATCSSSSTLAGNAAGTTPTTANCVLEYQANATGRNGLLYIQLTLTQSGEAVTLFQQIHVDNSP
ncbi:MAG: type II secretion system GspH family protein [Sulfuritalea sp.]|jgi:MSHA biogenesis protein MshO|nr:type II secretion system GspH family protein [Sulfuritalea sp.]